MHKYFCEYGSWCVKVFWKSFEPDCHRHVSWLRVRWRRAQWWTGRVGPAMGTGSGPSPAGCAHYPHTPQCGMAWCGSPLQKCWCFSGAEFRQIFQTLVFGTIFVVKMKKISGSTWVQETLVVVGHHFNSDPEFLCQLIILLLFHC